ncbi:MAG: amphi-Trp domain-containing protein [Humidesulfovibrio sp.]|nr:amphi-Trp domain-containing protein [Humidesulfovibrio sp.]
MSAEGKFEFDSVQDPTSIQDFLLALTEGFAKGRIVMRSEAEEITLLPGPLLGFSVKAKRKAGENKINIKIVWKDSRKEISAGDKSILIAS